MEQMELFYLILGIIFLVLGLISLIAYITGYEKLFWKKKRMIQFWGKKIGTIIHFIGYVLVPIIFGLFLIIRELV